ncbi:uncharacterized protein [Chelonus insularis]|uniref:uncharacterized protein n=1 Tax=Chelonus insularis TaxID=460826 RepID=UPI00158A7713|nr:uncharacterized protein LOC118069490 [Chelonus insularis]
MPSYFARDLIHQRSQLYSKTTVRNVKNSKDRKLIPGEVIHIDLTIDEMDEENNRSKKKNKKSKEKKLTWLKIINEEKVKKKNGKLKNHVEIVDAHSTENFEYITDFLPNYKPLFVNEISESTKPSNFPLCQDKNSTEVNAISSVIQDNCKKVTNDSLLPNTAEYSLQINHSVNENQNTSPSNSCKSKKYDTEYEKRAISNINDSNSLSSLDMCPVSTTVSSEDILNNDILWNDDSLFGYSDYKLDFDIVTNYSDDCIHKNFEPEPEESAVDINTALKNSCDISIVDSIDEYENIGILDSILHGDTTMPVDKKILEVSPPIKKANTNWNFLFDYHLANIEAPEDIILSSNQFVDPRLTRKNKDNKISSKKNYMTSLGLSKSKESLLEINKTTSIDVENIHSDCQYNNSTYTNKDIFENSELSDSFFELSSYAEDINDKNSESIYKCTHSIKQDLPSPIFLPTHSTSPKTMKREENHDNRINERTEALDNSDKKHAASSIFANVSSTTSRLISLDRTADNKTDDIIQRKSRRSFLNNIEEPSKKKPRISPSIIVQQRRLQFLPEDFEELSERS